MKLISSTLIRLKFAYLLMSGNSPVDLMGSPVTQIPSALLSPSPALLSSPDRLLCESLFISQLLTNLEAPTIDCGRIVLLEKLEKKERKKTFTL